MENKVVKRISMLFLQRNGDRVGLTKVFGYMPLERLHCEQVQQLHRKLFRVCGTNNLVVTLKNVDNTRMCSFENAYALATNLLSSKNRAAEWHLNIDSCVVQVSHKHSLYAAWLVHIKCNTH